MVSGRDKAEVNNQNRMDLDVFILSLHKNISKAIVGNWYKHFDTYDDRHE